MKNCRVLQIAVARFGIWVGILFLAAMLFSCVHSPTKSSALDETDGKMLEQLAVVFDAFRSQSAEIWNQNFRLDQMPLLLVRKGKNRDLYGFLVNHPKPESFEESEKVELAESLGLPLVYKLKPLPRKKDLAEFPYFMFQFELNGTNVFLLKYADLFVDPYLSPFHEIWPLFLTHEAFHVVQLHWQQPYDEQDIEGYPLDQTHLALIMLENEALKMSMAAAQTENMEYLRYFLAVREERIRLVPEVTELDFAQERHEGTAQYIQHRLGELLQNSDFHLQSFPAQLEMYSQIGVHTTVRNTAAFGRFYATGATLGYLLDKLEIRWKERVEQGESPYQVLRQSLRLNPGLDDLLKAKQKLNFPTIQIRAEKAALQEQKEPKDIFGSE